MIRISCVSYLNSAPFIFGIRKADFGTDIRLDLDIPSECARKLIAGEIDLGLVPVAVIPQVKGSRIVGRYCIGAEGPVRSVTLLGEVPLGEMREVLLDHQSRTSVALTRILAEKFWKISPVWTDAKEGFESGIRATTGGVVIGDRSLRLRNHFPFVTDLSEEWNKMTGLPFVFAAWVSNKELDPEFIRRFDQALAFGLQSVKQVIDELPAETTQDVDAIQYLTRDISYVLDERKIKGMKLFLSYLAESRS